MEKIYETFPDPVACDRLVIINFAFAQAERMMARPIMPAKIIFLDSATLSSFPPAVIHLNPPIRIMTTAITPRRPRATLIRLVMVSISGFWPRLPPRPDWISVMPKFMTHLPVPASHASPKPHGKLGEQAFPGVAKTNDGAAKKSAAKKDKARRLTF